MSDWWADAVTATERRAPRTYWPQMTDYLDGIETGRLNPDSPLAALEPVEGGFFGGPIALSGRAAVVFRMKDPSGRDWALRAFLAEPSPNLQLTCALSEIDGLPMPATSWFEEGIESDDEWWPVLLMPWCEGSPLDVWLDRNRSDPVAIRDVATTILEHVVDLAEAGIVHGDLQHGNILVSDDRKVTFVDLDGTVRCDASGRLCDGWEAPTEAGHPNYQHPERTRNSLWTPSVDLYSALVIDSSLRAIAIEPKLMDKYYVEDNLLLVATDLDDPVASEAFDRMRALGDEAIDVRCAQLLEFSRRTISGKRPAESILFAGEMPDGPAYQRPWYTALPTHAVAADWAATEAVIDLRRTPAEVSVDPDASATIAPATTPATAPTPQVVAPAYSQFVVPTTKVSISKNTWIIVGALIIALAAIIITAIATA